MENKFSETKKDSAAANAANAAFNEAPIERQAPAESNRSEGSTTTPATKNKKIELDPSIAPWKQQPGEASKAYHLFTLYRNYGPTRTASTVLNKYRGSEIDINSLSTYSGRYRWRERAEAYDAYLLEKETKDNEKLIRKFNKKRMKEAINLMDEAYDQMKADVDKNAVQPRENRERYKLGFEMFRAINQLDREDKKKVEHSGSVSIIFGDEVKDV